jgi:hypothetical protein
VTGIFKVFRETKGKRTEGRRGDRIKEINDDGKKKERNKERWCKSCY